MKKWGGITMNFLFLSPMFPKNYWHFCNRMKNHGVNVLAIGDMPIEAISQELKDSVTEYCYVSDMENYDYVYRCVAYLASKYGKIDWLESNNEYWLELDSHLRTDFNINTGMKQDVTQIFKTKSGMKAYYEKAGVKTARYHLVDTLENGQKFISEVGYPVVVKPDNGVGAAATYKINNDQELVDFYNKDHITQYIMEEFVNGLIISYDGIANRNHEVLFETSHVFPQSIMNIVNGHTDMYYYSLREIPEQLQKLGRSVVREFPVHGRFFHCEFFQLLEDREGLGKKGDFVGLEVNMRPPGGYTPDMMNWANDIDVYDIYADMVTTNQSHYHSDRPYHCVHCGRRDGIAYAHDNNEIVNRYGHHIVMNERMPDILSGAMGNYTYTARFGTMDEMNEFVDFVLKKEI